MVGAVRRGFKKTLVAEVFDVSRKTVTTWSERAKHRGRESFRDKKRENREVTITLEVELAIIAMRTTFDWGTARIQQGFMELPDYAKEVIPHCVQRLKLSRTSIDEVLKKHDLNGYKKNYKHWKFFRAKRRNELWQVDLKGPYSVQGKKYWWAAMCHARFAPEARSAPTTSLHSTAKSIALCKLHPLKNLHGGLRCAKRGWHLKPAPRLQLRLRRAAKPNCYACSAIVR